MAGKDMEKSHGFSMIRCPYCMEEFAHPAVHFKAEPYEKKNNTQNLLEMESEPENKFRKGTDQRYFGFWSLYGGPPFKWRQATWPVITPGDHDMMMETARSGSIEGAYSNGYYETDKDGFVTSVQDIHGRRTSVRICPFCHNPLWDAYGKHPTYFIPVIGITSSGKSVYLSRLLENLSLLLPEVGITFSVLDSRTELVDEGQGARQHLDNVRRFLRRTPVNGEDPLPQGTSAAVFLEPIIFNLSYIKNNQREMATLVLYDIAGENCVDPTGMSRYGRFISNADGIIFLVDPNQFRGVVAGRRAALPSEVLNAMGNAFMNQNNGRNETFLAVSLSKCDELEVLPDDSKRQFGLFENSLIFKDSEYPGRKISEYTIQNLRNQMREFYEKTPEGRAMLQQIDQWFNHYGLFGITSLSGAKLEQNKNDGRMYITNYDNIQSKRIEEPLFWILAELGIAEWARIPRPARKGLFGLFR